MKLKMSLLMTLFAASNLVANICVKNDTIWPIRLGAYYVGIGNFTLVGPIQPGEKASTGDDLLNIKTRYRVDVLLPNGEWQNHVDVETSAPGHRFILVSFQTTDKKTGKGEIKIYDTPALTAAC